MILIGLASERSTVVDFKGSHFEREIVLWGVRWYVEYPISYRQLAEMMEERGVEVDHSSFNRWVLKYVPLLDQAFRARKRRVGGSWRMGRDLRADQGPVEVSVSGRRHLAQGNRPEWCAGENAHGCLAIPLRSQ
jgi:transposase-like protein